MEKVVSEIVSRLAAEFADKLASEVRKVLAGVILGGDASKVAGPQRRGPRAAGAKLRAPASKVAKRRRDKPVATTYKLGARKGALPGWLRQMTGAKNTAGLLAKWPKGAVFAKGRPVPATK